jgi:hypothetical protein
MLVERERAWSSRGPSSSKLTEPSQTPSLPPRHWPTSGLLPVAWPSACAVSRASLPRQIHHNRLPRPEFLIEGAANPLTSRLCPWCTFIFVASKQVIQKSRPEESVQSWPARAGHTQSLCRPPAFRLLGRLLAKSRLEQEHGRRAARCQGGDTSFCGWRVSDAICRLPGLG